MSKSNEGSSQLNSLNKHGKSKNGSKKPKNEGFYVKKRNLIRTADSINKYCDSDVFFVVHQKQTGKIFSYSTDNQNFSLQ